MKASKRVANYRRANKTSGAGSANRRSITPKQRRRVVHKSRGGLKF